MGRRKQCYHENADVKLYESIVSTDWCSQSLWNYPQPYVPAWRETDWAFVDDRQALLVQNNRHGNSSWYCQLWEGETRCWQMTERVDWVARVGAEEDINRFSSGPENSLDYLTIESTGIHDVLLCAFWIHCWRLEGQSDLVVYHCLPPNLSAIWAILDILACRVAERNLPFIPFRPKRTLCV